MAQRYVRCPLCYSKFPTADDVDVAFELEIHRMSGRCRAAVPVKVRAPRKNTTTTRLDDLLGGDC